MQQASKIPSRLPGGGYNPEYYAANRGVAKARKSRYLAKPEKAEMRRISEQKYKETHKEEIVAYGVKRYETHKEHMARLQVSRNNVLKQQVFSHYCGGEPRCQCLGCYKTHSLQVDHVVGGRQHVNKKGIRVTGPPLWRWLIKAGFPEGYQILCACCNCMSGKGTKERCPLYGQTH
jgi:hypothetical protein